MAEENKSLEDDIEEFEGIEERVKILSMMKNMIRQEGRSQRKVEIFDEDNHNIYPTFWYKERQLATCRKCGKTDESVVRKRCGIGNLCCSCCLSFLCMCVCVPCMCCMVYDTHHFCSHCNQKMGIKTFI